MVRPVVPYLYYPDAATCRIHVLVDDVDAHCERARAEGAVIHAEPEAHFDDVRIYIAGDCGGQQWIFAQPIEPG